MGYTTAFQLVIGIILFYFLASIDSIELFKLFNALGLLLDIIGIFLLSKIVVDSTDKHQKKIEYCYAFLWAALFYIPSGMIAGNILLFWFNLPSAITTTSFAAAVGFWVFIPLFIIDYSGEIFKFKFYQTTSKRIIFMGWYLLLTGLFLQFSGAIMDLGV